jgi:hypothetical protein
MIRFFRAGTVLRIMWEVEHDCDKKREGTNFGVLV